MKKILIASLALASANVSAQNQSSFDGFLSAGVGTNKISVYEDSDNSNMTSMRATFSFAHSTGFGIQIDNVVENQEFYNEKFSSNDLALHGFYRRDNYLVGAIHQTRNFRAKADESVITLPLDRTFTGFEGQYDFGNLTVYGLTARDKIGFSFFGPGNATGHLNSAEARYFFNDNLRTDFSYSTSKLTLEGEGSATTNTTSVGVEYKFKNSPLSAFAKYQNMNGELADTDRFFVGVTFNLGKESLKDRNSSGSSLNPISVDNQILGFFGAGPT